MYNVSMIFFVNLENLFFMRNVVLCLRRQFRVDYGLNQAKYYNHVPCVLIPVGVL
jgi:hypothetical protein